MFGFAYTCKMTKKDKQVHDNHHNKILQKMKNQATTNHIQSKPSSNMRDKCNQQSKEKVIAIDEEHWENHVKKKHQETHEKEKNKETHKTCFLSIVGIILPYSQCRYRGLEPRSGKNAAKV